MGALEYMDYYTKEDYYKWEGDWELIYGYPYAMAPFALPTHQKISVKIVRQLDENLDNCPECSALMEVEVEFNEDTIVRPDTMVVCFELDKKITKTPELIFEVVSKSSARRDEFLKFELYEREGVKYYSLVYPDNKKIKVFKLENGKYRKIGDFYENDTFLYEVKCPIKIDFGKIFK